MWSLAVADYRSETSSLVWAQDGKPQPNIAAWVLLSMFTMHYINRTLIFPLRIRNGKPTPFIPFILATGFCAVNGYMQSNALTSLYVYPKEWILDIRFIAGTSVSPLLHFCILFARVCVLTRC